jgi:hypothetical protein
MMSRERCSHLMCFVTEKNIFRESSNATNCEHVKKDITISVNDFFEKKKIHEEN